MPHNVRPGGSTALVRDWPCTLLHVRSVKTLLRLSSARRWEHRLEPQSTKPDLGLLPLIWRGRNDRSRYETRSRTGGFHAVGPPTVLAGGKGDMGNPLSALRTAARPIPIILGCF